MGSNHQEILYNEAWFQKKYRLWNQTALVQNPNFDIYSLGELGQLTSPSLLLLACRMTVIIPALEDMEKELNENIYVKYLGEYLVHGWCQIYISCHWYKERVASAAPWRMVGVRGGKVSTAWAKARRQEFVWWVLEQSKYFSQVGKESESGRHGWPGGHS